MILGGSKFTGIVLQGPKFKTKQFWNQKGKPHTMTHGRNHLIVFGRKLKSLNGMVYCIILVLLNHTSTRGRCVARMQDLFDKFSGAIPKQNCC